jgi:Reverse transcriptase (RNA-dependent DNA polymerase).
MMEYGEQHNLLAPEQFGSRKHKSAIEQAANKRFTMDIIRQSGNRAMYIANDAKSCYDRILLMVAYLTMRNFGIPQSAAVCTISTILNMKHHIRTKYGDSQDYYGGDKWVEKPHGCGQGNGYGPALWACISSPLLHILREYGHGTHIVLPLSRLVLHISAFSFVDDTDIIQTKPTYNNSMMDVERKVFQESQKALDQWASVLACTGGALEPDKSFCIYINPQWKGPTRMLEPSKTARTIHMTDTDGHRIPLKQKKAHEAFFSLGIWHSPSGDERSQYQHLTQIIQKWGKATTTNKMTWFETRLAIKHTLGRTLTYSLPAIALSSNQCNKLQRLLHREVLGKMGIVRTAPSTIVTAPIYFGGLGVLDFEVAQLISHVQLLLQHGNETDTLTGQLLRATFEYHALEMGLPGDPLTMQVNEYGTLNTWISHTIRQLHKYDMRVASDISGLCSWTHGDRFIMEILSAQSTDGDLAIINKVRMYLRVVTISDLLTADGKHFDSQLLQGIRGLYNPQPSYARYNWPEVPQPTSREQNTWKRAMRQILSLEMYDPGHMALHTLLWRHQAVEYCRWGYSLATNKIYEYNDTKQWNIWEPFCDGAWRRTRQTSNLYMKRGTTRTLPDDVAVVSINRHHEYVRPVHIGCMEQPTEIHRQRNPKNEKMHTTALHRGFVYNIVMGNGQIFSDGSHMEGKSSRFCRATTTDVIPIR